MIGLAGLCLNRQAFRWNRRLGLEHASWYAGVVREGARLGLGLSYRWPAGATWRTTGCAQLNFAGMRDGQDLHNDASTPGL